MREATRDRISRLEAGRQELLRQVKGLRGNHVRNLEHKVSRLNDQLFRITEKIMKLKGVTKCNSERNQ